ncbi:MAG TPA: hypothetical protein PK736_08050 [Bacteroidia bacterium]|nr:hypothetical protein [Bacteroidia bacterium]
MRGKIVEYFTKANIVTAIIFGLLAFATANIPRTSFYTFIGAYAVWFIFYLLICKNHTAQIEKEIGSSSSPIGFLKSLSAYQWIAILSRMVLIFSVPLLSDDVYRFIWDGQIVAAGHNPFDYTPDWYMSHAHTIKNLNTDLYNQLNSKPFYTVYPPVCQAIFGVSAYIGGASIKANIFCIKLFLLAFEIATIIILPKILKQFSINKNYAIVYLLNPLVIIETIGNCHFEGIMVSLFLMAIYFFKKNNLTASAILFALSILTKLITVLGLPIILLLMPWCQRFLYSATIAMVILISFSPIINNTMLQHFTDSVGLYFNYLEFNASIYTLLKSWGWKIFNQDITTKYGFILPLISTAVIIYIYLQKHTRNFFTLLMAIFVVYYIFARTVHPWYLLPIILFGTMSGFRFPIWWSAIVAATYITYSVTPYQENYWLVLFEYITVLVYAGYELKARRSRL